MTVMPFVHLRLHSEYSMVDGITRLEGAVHLAAQDGQPALAITDLGNTFGFIKFYKAARAQGVKPLLGVDAWVAPEDPRDPPSRILLLAQNLKGYRNLCTLISRAWLTNAQKDRGEMAFAWFSEASEHAGSNDRLHDGLICLSGGRFGLIGQLLMRRSAQAAEQAAQWAQRYQSVFGDRFYLEVHRAGFDDDELLVRQTVDLAVRADIPVVATHPIQFLNAEDFRSHEAKVCIARGETLADPRRLRDFTAQQYLKSQQEMEALFADIPAALANTVHIAERCSLTLQLGTPQLPDFPIPQDTSLDSFLRQASEQGLQQRLIERFSDPVVRAQKAPEYEARLALECDTIIQMGFPGYFLIVADFINWAKSHGVPVGPGRGSGAGSLVAYSLGITDLDPLPYALLFERFLNPERVSMPDFDIDFCQEKRHKVIDYVRSRYGSQAVSQIVTFGTMASRAVIRDAGRVLDLPYNFCDQLSKLIPVVQNKPLSLQEAREKEPILAEREKKEDEVRELLAVAGPLEDLVRNVGMHAGGVLIAPGRLTDFCPLYQAPGASGDEGVVSMYDKDDVEAAGLVKFDFLGLKNLTIIQAAVDTINRLYPEKLPFRPAAADAQGALHQAGPLTLAELNGFDDSLAYQVLKEANTTGIFQVESQGMRRYLVKLAPDQFEDIIAMLALYRPGPLNSGMVDDFILRKRGQQKIDYFHPDLKDCLAPTYGVIVYQEQVMQIAQIIAGYSLGGADLLRRAMGKKKPEEMAQQRSIFLEGAQKKGHSEALATQLFDLMEKFAEYGFNKSHTAAYAVITYQTAWLKAHYPAEFIAATLSGDMDDTDKVAFLVSDAKANGITVLPADINQSVYRFEPEAGRKAIRYGLGAIRGVGESAVAAIVRARAEGLFHDLFDFCSRVDRRAVNKKAIEALVKAGAFDMINPEGARGRSWWLGGIGIALQAAEDAQASAHQGGLFDSSGGGSEAALSAVNLPQASPFSLRQMLLEEKSALGFCFSASLFDDVRDEMRRWAATPLARLQPSRDPIWMAGVIVDSRAQMTRRGMMRVVVIDDGSARLEVTVFNELYDSRRHVLRVDEPLLVQARVENDDYSGGLRGAATEVLTLAEARMRHAKGVRLTIPLEAKDAVDRLAQALRAGNTRSGSQTPSATAQAGLLGCPIFLHLVGKREACELILGESWRVIPSDERLSEIREAVGDAEVALVYPGDAAAGL